MREYVEAAGKFGGGVDEAIGRDDEEGSRCGVGGCAEPVVKEGEESAGRSKEGSKNSVTVQAYDGSVGGQGGAGGGYVPGVWVVAVGVRGKSADGAEGTVEFGAMWRAGLPSGPSWLGLPVGGAV